MVGAHEAAPARTAGAAAVLGAGSESDTNINIVDVGCTVSRLYPNQLYTHNYMIANDF